MFNVGQKVYFKEWEELEKVVGKGNVFTVFAGREAEITMVDGDYVKIDLYDLNDYFRAECFTTEVPKTVRELFEEICPEINFEELRDEIISTYREYNHSATEEGIEYLLRYWVTKNRKLIEMVQKSPDYNGNLQIVKTIQIDRDLDPNEIYRKLRSFLSNTDYRSVIYKKHDNNGNTFDMLFKNEIEAMSDKLIPSELAENKLKNIFEEGANKLFDSRRDYIPSVEDYRSLASIVNDFASYPHLKINKHMEEMINICFPKTEFRPGARVKEGQKSSRAFRRMFEVLGITSLPNDNGVLKQFNKDFAIYADLVSENKMTRTFVISVNPLDYLKMSFGNTWASCHTIDKSNRRNMPNSYSGQYCGGTLSYMLDSVSMVSYMLDEKADKTHPDREAKILRNMIHYNDGVLIQGRVYPQSKDGNVDLYATFRHLIQNALCECLGIEYIDSHNGNDTWIKKGKAYDYDELYSSSGVHYRDYTHFSDCNISYIRGTDYQSKHLYIGSYGICGNCGSYTTESSYLNCDDCQ